MHRTCQRRVTHCRHRTTARAPSSRSRPRRENRRLPVVRYGPADFDRQIVVAPAPWTEQPREHEWHRHRPTSPRPRQRAHRTSRKNQPWCSALPPGTDCHHATARAPTLPRQPWLPAASRDAQTARPSHRARSGCHWRCTRPASCTSKAMDRGADRTTDGFDQVADRPTSHAIR